MRRAGSGLAGGDGRRTGAQHDAGQWHRSVAGHVLGERRAIGDPGDEHFARVSHRLADEAFDERSQERDVVHAIPLGQAGGFAVIVPHAPIAVGEQGRYAGGRRLSAKPGQRRHSFARRPRAVKHDHQRRLRLNGRRQQVGAAPTALFERFRYEPKRWLHTLAGRDPITKPTAERSSPARLLDDH